MDNFNKNFNLYSLSQKRAFFGMTTQSMNFYSRLFGPASSFTEEQLYIFTNLIIRMSECTSPTSFILAVHSFLRDQFGMSYGNFTRVFEKYVFSFMFLIFGIELVRNKKKNGKYKSNVAYAQSFTDSNKVSFKRFIGQIRKMINDFDKIKGTEFAIKLSTFCSLLICMPFFAKSGVDSTWLGFSDLYHQRLKTKYNNMHSVNFCHTILDCTTFIVEKVISFLETGDYHSLYVDDEEVADYESKYDFLLYYSDKFSLLANKGKTLDEYRVMCDEVIQMNKKLQKFSAADKYRIKILKQHNCNLVRCKWRVDDKLHVSSERKVPISLCLYSAPGVGKSSLTDKLLHCLYENDIFLGQSNDHYDPKVKYMYNEDDEYMSEFKTSHEVCIMDDVDQFNDDINLSKKGGSISKSIYFVNSMPYITNQASLEDKGMIPFTCKYVIKTTNSRDAGISKVFRPGGGAYRREIFLDITVRPEYRRPGEMQLRGDLTDEGYKNHEMHYFQPRKYQVLSSRSSPVIWDKKTKTWVADGEHVDPLTFKELSVFLLEEVQKPHYNSNNVCVKSTTHFLSKKFCSECLVPGALCSCPEAQSDFVQTPNDVYLESLGHGQTIERMRGYYICYLIFMATLFYTLHVIFSRITNSEDPTFLTDWALHYMRDIPEYRQLPLPLRILPHSVQRRLLCTNWQRRIQYICKTFYKCTDLCQRFNQQRVVRFVRYGAGFLVVFLGVLKAIGCLESVITAQSTLGDPREEIDSTKKISAEDNPWKNTYVNMTRMSGPTSTITIDQLLDRIEVNCVSVQIYSDDGKVVTRGFATHGSTIIIPRHSLVNAQISFPFRMDLMRNPEGDSIGPSRYNLLIGENNISEPCDKSTDVLFVTHPSFGVFRDIRKFLIKGFKGKADGVMIGRDRKGNICRDEFSGFHSESITYKSSYEYHKMVGYKAFMNRETINGDCGSVYVVQTMNGCFIGGFHVAGLYSGDLWTCFIHPMNNEPYKIKCFQPLSYDGINLNEHYKTTEDLGIAQKLHFKCPVKKVSGNAIVYGSIKSHRRKMKSAVAPTLMAEEVLEHYGKVDFTHYSPKEIKSSEALYNNVSKMTVRPVFDFDKIMRAEDALYNWYKREIVSSGVNVPSNPYSLEVGINGIDEVPYLDRLPVSTSGGFAHKGAKSKYLFQVDSSEDNFVNNMINGDILEEYNNLVDKYKRGVRGDVVWDMSFKDEPLTAEKIRINKCRIFNSGPLHFSILLRQYFLWCIPFFSGKLRTKFGMALGANAHGKDWTTIYEHITRHGTDNMIAGDYKSFDKTMPPEMMTSAFNVLIRLAKDFGWKEEDLQIMRGLATDVCYPLSNVFGTIVGMSGSNPSGQSLTTPINGMCNIMYMMVACMMIEEDLGKSEINYDRFLDTLSIVTYGDDNCMSSSKQWVNHTSISDQLAKCGVTYTMADKNSESRPFINIDEVSFLKRNFVYHYNQKYLLAPLEESSIIKSLSICTKSSSINFKEQCAHIIYSAHREYYHYGKEVFESKLRFLNEMCDKYFLKPYLPGNRLLCYEELDIYN